MSTSEPEPVVEISTEEHLALIRERATLFLEAVGAANEAGVSQALVLPMLMELLRDSGVALPGMPSLG